MDNAKTAPKSSTQGFTLIEIVVALTLLSFSLGAVLTAVNRQSFQLQQLADRFYANRVAMQLASRFQALNTWPALGDRRDKVTVGDETWDWVMTASSTSEERMRRVEVRVYPDGQDGPVGATVVFFQSRL